MSNKLTDTQLVQEIKHVFEVEEFAVDAVRRVRELVAVPDSEEVRPTMTAARDLPFGMVSDVCRVLEAHGLQVRAPELKGHGITEVIIALGRVLEVMPHFLGGRAGIEQDEDRS